MKRWFQGLILGWLCVYLSGCIALVASGAATGALIAHDRRSAGTIVEDNGIELKVYKLIAQLDQTEQSHLSAVSYNGHLLLLGQTLDPQLKQMLEDRVRQLPKVHKVFNEIQVSTPTSLITRSSDAWITTKVKSEMLLGKHLDPTRVKVTTEDGVVYLMGLIHPQEEESAVTVARRTKGVKKVVKLFEFMDLPATPHAAQSLLPSIS